MNNINAFLKLDGSLCTEEGLFLGYTNDPNDSKDHRDGDGATHTVVFFDKEYTKEIARIPAIIKDNIALLGVEIDEFGNLVWSKRNVTLSSKFH